MSGKNKGKKKKTSAMPAMLFGLIGAFCGLSANVAFEGIYILGEGANSFLELCVNLFLLAAAYCVQLVLHETGHLLAGLVSGYGFESFRIGSLMLIKEGERLKFKRHSIAGTAGQCLMTPPAVRDGKYPVIFYNLGGVLINLLSAPLFFAVAFVLKEIAVLYVFCIWMAAMGLVNAVLNGIPLSTGTVNNDGSNAKELYKNPTAMLVFHNQFKILHEMSNGKRLRQMPSEWFFVPDDSEMDNSITASGAVFYENRLIDEGKYAEASELIDKLTNSDNALTGLHKNLLFADKITVDLILGADKGNVRKIYESKSFEIFKKQMRASISVVRTEYVWALLALCDEDAANTLLELFEKVAKTHPYASDVEVERELIDIARQNKNHCE